MKVVFYKSIQGTIIFANRYHHTSPHKNRYGAFTPTFGAVWLPEEGAARFMWSGTQTRKTLRAQQEDA